MRSYATGLLIPVLQTLLFIFQRLVRQASAFASCKEHG